MDSPEEGGRSLVRYNHHKSQLNAVSFACQIGVIGGDASNGPPAHVLVRVTEWDRHNYAENVALSVEHS